ncbi:MAG: hypothetical protein GF355_01950 [Candidatus Eisenbacteria bacterium]|nr:hypothetical protein [Candidatus Eisenbacteria bacterium]
MRRRVAWSWVFGAFGTFMGALIGLASAAENGESYLLAVLLHGVLGGYGFWSFYWGLLTVGGWLRRRRSSFNVILFMPIVGWLIAGVLYVFVVAHIGALYGAAGGAIYQYLKHRSYKRVLVAELAA